MMTLEETIEYYKVKANDIRCKTHKDYFFGRIDWAEKMHRDTEAEEYEQVAEWLKELRESKQLRNMQEDLKIIKAILIARGQAKETDFNSEADNEKEHC